MNTKQHRLRELRARWVRWDARLRGIGTDAPRATRRRMATGYLVCVAAIPAAALLLPDTYDAVWLVSFLGALTLLCVLSNATRNVADAPDAALDEMLTRIRDGYRSRAYRLLAVSVSMACIVLIFFTSPIFGLTLTDGIVNALIGPLFLLSFGLPTLIASWSLPDIDQPAESDPLRPT